MIATSQCHFDEATHTYTINGRVVPSVTEVITETVGSGYEYIPKAEREWYMQRGKAVHMAARLIAQGKQIANVDPRIEGRIAALRKFFAEVKMAFLHIEQPMYSETLRFAGTPDVVADYGGRYVIVDYKGTVDKDRIAWQLAGYAILFGSPRVVDGLGVELRDDGTYKLTPRMKLADARREFGNLLGTYNIRKRMGLVNKKETENATG